MSEINAYYGVFYNLNWQIYQEQTIRVCMALCTVHEVGYGIGDRVHVPTKQMHEILPRKTTTIINPIPVNVQFYQR